MFSLSLRHQNKKSRIFAMHYAKEYEMHALFWLIISARSVENGGKIIVERRKENFYFHVRLIRKKLKHEKKNIIINITSPQTIKRISKNKWTVLDCRFTFLWMSEEIKKLTHTKLHSPKRAAFVLAFAMIQLWHCRARSKKKFWNANMQKLCAWQHNQR